MKKYIFMVIMGFGALTARPQKLRKPEVDKITGDVTISAKEQVLSNEFTLIKHYLACNIAVENGYCSIYFHLKDGLNIQYSVFKGDKAIIKLVNGKLLEITAATDIYSSFIPFTTLPVAESYIPFDLSDDDVLTLKSGKISVIRITTSIGPFDYDISNGKAGVIKKQLELIY